jgi:hypothetical protein
MFGGEQLPGAAAADQPFSILLFDRAGFLMMKLGLLFLGAVSAFAVIVDRVAIAIGNEAIVESEIDQRIRLTAFQNGENPDFGLAARKKAAQRLIDEKLVEREMTVGRYPAMPGERKSALLASYIKENAHGDPAALDRQLGDYGLTRKDLMNDLARQQDLLTFLDLRFRPAVQVSEQEIQSYYREHFEATRVPLNDVRPEIENKLSAERADTELETWLKDQRRRIDIEYLEKDLAP